MSFYSSIRPPNVCLRRIKWRYLIVLFCVFSFILIEEINVGIIFTQYMNHYRNELTLPIRIHRTENSDYRIALAVIVKDRSNAEQYELARKTVRCYATLHKYDLHEIDISTNVTLTDWCPGHKDFMFTRHCVLSHLMKEWSADWVLFIDADMAIINPNHLIEEYIPSDNSTIVFYDRIMNHELMAGSYIIRNSEVARSFLQSWADYESRLPSSFHGSDNGAIHSVVLEWSLPFLERERISCERLWKEAKNYRKLYEYEACTRSIMEKYPLDGIKILHKGRHSWARDGWLTENIWSQNDFILHGWQKRRQDKMVFGRWHSPLVLDGKNVPLAECADSRTAHKLWRYKDTFFGTNEEVTERLKSYIEDIDYSYKRTINLLRKRNYIWW